jgi:crotonobetainyl-CoA:carnitine CoA-transferase CaiB-like acyl-CoA transferase
VGAYCGKVLADLGADVLKVERPGGDQLRRTPPFAPASDGGEQGLLFAWYHNNKRGITLDWTHSDAVALLAELAAPADVVVVSPDVREPLAGFEDPPSRPAWLPQHTTLCAITPYGVTGPWRHWRATPFTSFAASGQMHATGPDEGPPLAMPGQQLFDQASTRAATMVISTIASRFTGQTIDVSAHEVGAWQYQVIQRFATSGRILSRATNFGPPPGGIWQCRNGYVDIAAHSVHHWEVFVKLLGSPEELQDPMYSERAMRVALFDLLTTFITAHMANQSAQEFVDRGQALGLPCTVQYRPDEYLQDDHPWARGAFVQVENPALGQVTMPGPVVTTAPPLATYRLPAPVLGASNKEVYVDELGHSPGELDDWRERGLI